ncbi:MAG TPA: hypothetical protein VNE16_15355 [Vicinamibacterales bacterium]|nr:hypothetical protein [Vicinamibacterales bacterium]
MRKILSALAAASFVAVLAAPAFAATSVKGEVIDTVCYGKMGAKATGAKHAACALKCAKAGHVMAILTSDGTVYDITGKYAAHKNKALLRYVAKKVSAEGTVSEANGKKSIDVAKMMVEKGM